MRSFLLSFLMFAFCGALNAHPNLYNDAAANGNTNALVADAQPDANHILYVKKGATGTGSSWANALGEVADALKAATELNATTAGTVAQIWVAGGIYKPLYKVAEKSTTPGGPPEGIPTTDRDKAFILVKDVKVYGGFAGTEDLLTKRNLKLTANASILSGDISAANDNTDNAYHVVLSLAGAGTVALDGFTVKDGNADGHRYIKVPQQQMSQAFGGGIHIFASSAVLSNLIITANHSAYGGGLYNDGGSFVLTNAIIKGNSSADLGAGISNFGSGSSNTLSSVLTNVIISGNQGNGIYNNSHVSPVLTNVTINGNQGYGMYNDYSSNPRIRNSIIYGNSSGGVFNYESSYPDDQSSPVIEYSLVQGVSAGTGNIDGSTDPKFVDASNGDYHLQVSSQAINKGNNTYFSAGETPDLSLITTDLDGNSHIYGTAIDMGAYEVQTPSVQPDANHILYVKKGAAGDGSSWGNALGEVADALKAAAEMNATTAGMVAQIWVAGGIYKPLYKAAEKSTVPGGPPEGIPTTDRDKAFILVKDVKVYGGFAGTEDLLTNRNLKLTANASLLSGDVGAANDNTDNAYHVVFSLGDVGTAALDGFTVKDGNANGVRLITVNSQSFISQGRGGGIRIINSSLVLSNLIITANHSSFGGGLYNDVGSFVLTNAIIKGNSSADYAAGISNFSSSSSNFPSAVLTNVIISGNQGDGIYNNHFSPVLTNVTIGGNQGYGIYNNFSSNPRIRNSIIYGNSNGSVRDYDDESSPVIEYSLVQGVSAGTGNIDGSTDPKFVDASNGDYHLQVSSQAINKGNNTYYSAGGTPDLSLITTDLEGNPRIYGSIIDLGAYESSVAPPAKPVIIADSVTTFCSGGSVTLSAPEGFTSYLWSNGATIQSINVIESGSYTVIVTDANGAASPASDALAVTVNALPAKPVITAGGSTTFCSGGSVTLSAPDGFTSYLWSNGATTQSVTANTTGSYSVVVTNAAGCASTASDAQEVTVNALPAKPVITAGGSTTFCSGGSVTLSAPDGFTSYLWSNGATTQSVTANTTGSYSVVVTNASGCASTASDVQEVTVNEVPAKPVITAGGSTTFCSGGSVTLSAPDGFTSYLWSNGATTQSATANTSGSYSVVVTDATGCTSAASDAQVITVNALPAKPVITASGPTTFYQGGSVTLSAPAGFDAYSWSNGATTSSILVTSGGSYSVSVTNNNGCSSMVSDVVTVTVKPSMLTVSYMDADKKKLTNNSLRPYLQLNNEGTNTVPYKDITIRYWLTVEDFAPMTNLYIDWAPLGTNKIHMKYVKSGQPFTGAFGYIEYSFDPSAGNLTGNSNSGVIQSRAAKSNWTNFNEADDYSYAAVKKYTENNKITVYQDGILVWGIEPAAIAPTLSLKAYSKNTQKKTTTNSMSNSLKLNNEGNVPVNFSDITVRYWFTADGTQPLNYYLDYTPLGNSNVKGKFVKMPVVTAAADTYLELSFSAADSLYPLSTTGDIQQRISKSNWSNFSLLNDYSYEPGISMMENAKMTVYVKGSLVYGTEPSNTNSLTRTMIKESSKTSLLTNASPDEGISQEGLTVTVLNNPILGDDVELIIRGVSGQNVRVTVEDANGRIISQRQLSHAGSEERTRLSVNNSAAQLFFVRVATAKEMKTVKVMRGH